MPKFTSATWSFLEGRPVLEIILTFVRFTLEQAKLISNRDLYTQAQSERLLTLCNPTPVKHLGLTADINATTTLHCAKLLRRFSLRLLIMNITRLRAIPMRQTLNTLLNTLSSFATLQAGLTYGEILAWDRMIIRLVQRQLHFPCNDAPHAILLAEKNFGYGIKSLICTHTINLARELEVILNSSHIDERTARCRLAAAKRYHALPPPLPKNFVFESISFLSRLGFHLRDADDGIVNYLLVLLDDEVFQWYPLRNGRIHTQAVAKTPLRNSKLADQFIQRCSSMSITAALTQLHPHMPFNVLHHT